MPRRDWYKALNAPAFTMRRPASAGMETYSVHRSGVPLQGGQAQGFIAGYAAASGSITSPAAFQTLTSTQVHIAGTYTVNWTVTLSGALTAADTNNFQLYRNGTLIANSVNADVAGSYPQVAPVVTFAAGDFMEVTAGPVTPTTGAVYGASLAAPPNNGTLTLQIGPQGAGTVWYPAQVTTSTTSGVNDVSTCLVYMGAAGTPITLMGTLFPGGAGVLAVAFPPLTVGLFIIAKFSGAKPGDVAAVNVTGTMDYLDTPGPL